VSAHEPGADAAVRAPAVAGTFYPADPARLGKMVAALLAAASDQAGAGGAAAAASATVPQAATASGAAPGAATGDLVGILVPHAGLAYSGLVAAAGWRLVPDGATVVILGTNHTASWLDGVGAWETGRWRTPLGEVAIDIALAAQIGALGPPFGTDRAAHLGEHSIEVQLPLLLSVAPAARIVPLAVGAGTGAGSVAAGQRLGALLARRRAGGARIVLAISSDMAHYPPADACARVTAALLPAILGLLPEDLAREEAALGRGPGSGPGMACGMCGIEPAVLGLAALRAMGATHGVALASGTSADAGADPRRAVGYLSVAFGG
jgi:AmmeMemoRadiSam system protein B